LNCDAEPDSHSGEELLQPPSPDQLRPWLAVLSAASIRYRVEEWDGGCGIYVRPAQAAAARRELAEYERSVADWAPGAQGREDQDDQPRTSEVEVAVSLAVAAGLLLFHRRAGALGQAAPVFQQGCADSARMVAGEWWRAVTALTLHADLTHVLGNAAFCFFFGVFACRQAGVGVGWLAILLSGVLGNLAKAHVAGPGHVAVGASTATFGALGLLAVYQLARNVRRYGKSLSIWNRAWLPLGAAAAMLALLGAGPRADMVAHLCGLGAGLLLGAGSLPLLKRRLPGWCQALLLAVGLAVVHGSWQRALGQP